MMSQLTTRDEGLNKQLKPQIYQGKGRGQSRNFTIYAIIISEVIKIGTDQIADTEEFSMDKIEVGLDKDKVIGMIIGEEILEAM